MKNTERGSRTGVPWLAIPLLFIFLLLTSRIHGQDPLTTVEITLTGGAYSVQQILERITLQTGYRFTYDADLISGGRQVEFRAEGIPLRIALDSLFIAWAKCGRHFPGRKRGDGSWAPAAYEAEYVH